MATTNPIDEYLAALDEPKRTTLTSLRDTIMAIVPDAEQCISYGLPGAGVHSRFLLLSAMGGGCLIGGGAHRCGSIDAVGHTAKPRRDMGRENTPGVIPHELR
jgi:hypothetical protein